MNETDIKTKIAELEAQLKTLSEQQEAERKERRATAKPQWKFTFTPSAERERAWLNIRPGTGVKGFILRGEVINVEEMTAAGYREDELDRFGGAMNYLVNFATETPRIIKADGGGRIFIGGSIYNKKDDRSEDAFINLEGFLKEHRDGGDVTDIMLRYANLNIGW